MTATLSTLYVLLLLAAVLQGPARRRLALAGLVPYAVAMASYAVTPGSADLRQISAAARTSGAVFFGVNTGLLALGAGLAAAAAVGELREHPRSLRWLWLAAASIFAMWQLRGLAAASGITRSAVAAVGAGTVLVLSGFVLPRLRRSGGSGGPAPDWPAVREHPVASAAFVAGALGVGLGSHAGLVFLGLVAAAAADYLVRRARGQAGFPWLPVATLGVLPVWWLLATIAGPVGLAVASLRDVPLSPRAEVLLALPLALVAWSCLGLWPAHRLFPGGLLAPLGVALWLRVARPALADGLDHWQPLLMPLGVLGVWGGAVTGRSTGVLNGLAFVALASEAGGSPAPALLLAAAAVALAEGRGPGALRGLVERLSWAIAVLVLPLVLEAGFRRQVTYTLAAAGGAAAAVWLGLAPPRGDRGTPGRSPGAAAA